MRVRTRYLFVPILALVGILVALLALWRSPKPTVHSVEGTSLSPSTVRAPVTSPPSAPEPSTPEPSEYKLAP